MWGVEPTQEKGKHAAERRARRKELVEAGNGEARFGVSSAGSQSNFGPVFPQHDPIHPFWNGHAYSGHCMLEVWNLHSDLTGSGTEDTVLSLRRDSGL